MVPFDGLWTGLSTPRLVRGLAKDVATRATHATRKVYRSITLVEPLTSEVEVFR